jgi:biopolymer transport protein TolR
MAAEVEKLTAAQRGRIRRLSQPKELSPDEEGGELNIVPFLDIVTNVLMFVLATVSVTFTAMIDTDPPKASGASARPPSSPSLSLNVIIVRDGFIISALGQRIGPGCGGAGGGLAVGKKQEDYDFEALKKCAVELKKLSDDKDEKQVTIAADKEIAYQTIISTIDALRRDPEGKDLFTEVSFGMVK